MSQKKQEKREEKPAGNPLAAEAGTRALLRWGLQHSPMPVALVGPPRQGKTTLTRLVAEELGWSYRVSNVQYLNPEEIGGIMVNPGKAEAGKAAKWTLPSMLTDDMLSGKPYLWVIDEIDKAHEDAMGCLLSLFDFQRRIHDTVIPPSVRICAILNDPDALIEALAGRFAYLAFPAEADLAGRLDTMPKDMKALADRLYMAAGEIKFPSRPSAPESTYALSAWTKAPGFWSNEAVRSRIVRGLFPLNEVPEVLGYLTGFDKVDGMETTELVEWVLTAPISTVGRLLIAQVEAIMKTGPEQGEAVLDALDELAERPDLSDEHKRLLERFQERGIPRLAGNAKDSETCLLQD